MRIAVAHDFFRSPVLDAGDSDLTGRFLLGLIGPGLHRLGHAVVRVSERRSDGGSAVADIARRHGWPPVRESWIRAYSDPAALPEIAPLLAMLRGFDLVIGWEFPPNMMRFMLAAGIAFIDIGIHAIRFCPDLFLRVRTNDPRIAEHLAAQETGDGVVRAEARRLMAESAPPRMGGPRLLFAGQMEVDASLLEDGKLVRIETYVERLRQAAAEAGGLLLKPHPHGTPHRDVRRLHGAVADSIIVDDNIYALLAAPDVDTIVTLSSSVADEAEMFGKRAIRLIVPDNAPERFEPEVSRFFRIDARIGTAGFWSALLARRGDSTIADAPPRKLREMFSYRWGHAEWPPALRDRSIAPGTRLTFAAVGGAAAAHCVFGWSGPEEWGIWSDGDRATLLFARPPDGHGVRVCLKVMAFAPEPDERRMVEFELRPERLGWAMQFAGGGAEIVFDIAPGSGLPDGGLAELVMTFDDVKSPAERGLSSDQRKLGLGLLALEATPIR